MSIEQRATVTIPLGEASVPTRFVSFNDLSDNKEHLAILYGTPEQDDTPLVRLHSECLTGDVFGSQRCDCGEQLHEAQRLLADQGGVLLYLRQEGRGIGLYNKLDAYALQDKGIDTYTANEMLGFAHDMRDFKPAAEMLLALGIKRIRLLSNNPHKASQLQDFGIEVVDRQDTGVYVNQHNAAYLKAKVDQQAHTILLDQARKPASGER
ncbi:GTP cyclohydrolase II [Saccharospirillum alexandrii]|uniref:GTP cyclohydrolase II n=1 Tax=Saccharospirillum alexandrii TaxID=2448477 RepID=UPI000FD7654E|nr:GTP cyclohydrolase II [Saccharospirillum alexandrii]